MNAYIKNGKIIINNNVDTQYKEELQEFISKTKHKALKGTITYDLDGNPSGIVIEID